MNSYETVIGLEVHTQLKTESKIFCSCPTTFDSPPNTNICPVCCGYPGVLPVFNQKALELAIRVSLALNCQINPNVYFERKNYFYPDLPKNFQISQYKMPLGHSGYLKLASGKTIRINRVHLEEDAGKLIHREDCSLIDFNRTGTPLLEIVSEPEINSPEEAFDYLRYLKLTLIYIQASDCDMERGSLRCDANISLRKKGDKILGTKVELKNMNTFKGVKAALEHEVRRQAKVLQSSGTISQETRLWDAGSSKTVVMRTKEQAHDYRYFPEPDLLDVAVPGAIICSEKTKIKELPLEKEERFKKNYGIVDKELEVFISNVWLADFLEEALKFYHQSRELVNWVLGPFLEQVNLLKLDPPQVKISAESFAKIVKYFSEGKMNNLAAKKILSLTIATNDDIDEVIRKEKLIQVSDENGLIAFVDEAIKENPKAISEYLEGKHQAIQFLVGQVMRKSKGKANPKVARDMLEKNIKEAGR
ncbi:MAG: Asp-tRNA(Asn)/Glu-tRNA(Gln) amidotransferase subunit GatB [Candidatus Omnitrophica bacterium]|nr:Asp-tRNA(Asn)/Glu-tRNA(Gln) amidotransferase subunit GatB [Candidatus Omnitrophota bacterium]